MSQLRIIHVFLCFIPKSSVSHSYDCFRPLLDLSSKAWMGDFTFKGSAELISRLIGRNLPKWNLKFKVMTEVSHPQTPNHILADTIRRLHISYNTMRRACSYKLSCLPCHSLHTAE